MIAAQAQGDDDLKIEEMQHLISLLKDFKDELEASDDRRDINRAMKIIDKTIEEKRYHSD